MALVTTAVSALISALVGGLLGAWVKSFLDRLQWRRTQRMAAYSGFIVARQEAFDAIAAAAMKEERSMQPIREAYLNLASAQK